MLATRPALAIKDIEDFFDAINSNHPSTFLPRFRIHFFKYIRHVLLKHQLSPDKNLPRVKLLMMDFWQQILKNKVFDNTLSSSTIELIENELKNDCNEIKSLWKDHSEDIEQFIRDLENSISSKSYQTEIVTIIPSRFAAGHYRYKTDSYPVITELDVGIEYLKRKFYESAVEKFQQGIDKIKLIPIEGVYNQKLIDLKKNKAYALHSWAIDMVDKKVYDEAFKHARAAVVELDNLPYQDLSVDDHHTLMTYVNFFLEVFNEYSLKLEQALEFKKAIELYRSAQAETKAILKVGAASILKMLARTYYNWGIKTAISQSIPTSLEYFELGLAEFSKIPPGSADSNAADLVNCFNAAITLCCWMIGTNAFNTGNYEEAAQYYIRSLRVEPQPSLTSSLSFMQMIRNQSLYWLPQSLAYLTRDLTNVNQIFTIIESYKKDVTNEKILWAIDKVLYYNLVTRAEVCYHSNDTIKSMNLLNAIPMTHTPTSLGMLPNDVLLNPAFKFHQFIFQLNILYRLVLLKSTLSPDADVGFTLQL